MVKVCKLFGKQVITTDGKVLGEIEGSEVDSETWQMTHFYVSLSGEATKEFGFRKPILGSVNVCLPVSIIKSIGEVISLNKSMQETKDLKECKT